MRRLAIALGATILLTSGAPTNGQPVYAPVELDKALPQREWERIESSVDRGLAYIAKQQRPDGSLPSDIGGQPAVTSLGVMAYLSRGHRPGEGPYGKTIDRAIDYVLSVQEDSGLLCSDKRRYSGWANEVRPHTATYNHAISGLMLGEAYGQGSEKLSKRLKPSIERALTWARRMQQRPPLYPEDRGGWRYLHIHSAGKPRSDLSATGWFVMFYRSARNAEFQVPEAYVQEAATFAKRCYDRRSGVFWYGPTPSDRHPSRAMTGAGILVLTVAGQRDEALARNSGRWILEHPFNRYADIVGTYDRFHYGAYYCSQAMYLLGGEYWARFYPTMSATMLAAQKADGGWPVENGWEDYRWGRCYTTALAVLALTPPYQMLPIYQR